jgi:hypothetical protein
MGYASAMPAFKLWVFDKGIVFFRVAEMKPLRNNVAQVFVVRFTFAVQILLYLFSRHFFSFVCLTFPSAYLIEVFFNEVGQPSRLGGGAET